MMGVSVYRHPTHMLKSSILPPITVFATRQNDFRGREPSSHGENQRQKQRKMKGEPKANPATIHLDTE